MPLRRVYVPDMARLPAFCHATVGGGQVFVAGILGTAPGTDELVPGGTGPQTVQTLRNIETVLRAAGCGLGDLAKVDVFLSDMGTFDEMNQAYVSVLGPDPPARITVGCTGLALGAAVEMTAVALLPEA